MKLVIWLPILPFSTRTHFLYVCLIVRATCLAARPAACIRLPWARHDLTLVAGSCCYCMHYLSHRARHLISVRRAARSRLLCVVRGCCREASHSRPPPFLCVVPCADAHDQFVRCATCAIAAHVARLAACLPVTPVYSMRASSRDAAQPCPTPNRSPHCSCIVVISSRNANHRNEKRIMAGITKG
jgi:hypothetical protein